MAGTLLALYTCHEYNYKHDLIRDWFTRPVVDRRSAIRDTWWNDITIDHKMFYGRCPDDKACAPLSDEVFLECPDNYYQASEKTRALVKWALDHEYDRLIKVDDDVFLYWDRLAFSKAFTQGDYVGGAYLAEELYAYGPCYILSRRAMGIIVNHPTRHIWAEDKWVGDCLSKAGVGLEYDPRFFIHRPPLETKTQYVDPEILGKHDYISIHSLTPEVMRSHYECVKRCSSEVDGSGI